MSEERTFYFDRAVKKSATVGAKHYHNNFELYYLKSGACNYFIDNRSFEVLPGDIILIPQGVIHRTIYDNTPYTRWLINCDESFIPKSVLPHLPSMLYLYRNPAISDEVDLIMEKIHREYESGDEHSPERLSSLTAELFILLARNISQKAKVETANLTVERTVNYIKDNYMNDISLGEMAKLNAISPEHLSRTFKKETGFGFSEYLTLVRLQRAEYMLKNEPGRSISEVAYACGFNDSNYFSGKFKKAYGIPPSNVKKQKEN